MRIANRRISRKLILIVAPIVLVLVGAGAAFAATSFSDIAGNTHEQSIMNMADRGVTAGYPDGTFRPNQPVTRGQMMTFLDRYQSGIGCTDCHVEGTLIVSKRAQFEEQSVHGTGEAFERGTSGSCAGCHGTEGSKARINAGKPPHDASVVGVENVSPMDCRTCHDIHTTYTGADWSLVGDKMAVKMEYTAGTFDKGSGNLCANCHQIRNPMPVAIPAASTGQITPAALDGQIDLGTNTRFGQHYGVEAQMLLGEGGYGVTGSPSVHYLLAQDSCVTCHMGAGAKANHTYEPAVSRCTSCHPGLANFDYKGVQTDVTAMLAEAKDLLIASGIMNAEDRSIPGIYPEKVAAAMWNYKLAKEDDSKGVHNSAFTKALLQSVIDTLK